MRISIVDDQELERTELHNYVLRYCTENQLHSQIESFDNGESFLSSFTENMYDLIFLDIYMDKINGIELAEAIRQMDTQVQIIFSTSSTSHALEGFRVRATDYMVKPYTYEDLKNTLDYCAAKQSKKAHYIEVKEGRYFTKVLISDIIYTDYYNHYIQIHTSTKVIRSYMSFSDFSPMLECYPQFLSCYRNCLVNMDKVSSFDDNDFLMETGIRIPISRNLKNTVRQAYSDYIFDSMNESE